MKPIKDCTIIEVASVLAGPAVGMFFAELGARVIKIENPLTKGDVTRSWKLPVEDPDMDVSAYFASVNAGKEHVFLDLTSFEGQEKLHQLLGVADVLITNFKHGDSQKFGLEANVIREKYPKLIIGQIEGFTFEKNRTAYDVVMQAECGFMSINGQEDSGPLKMPVAFIDILAAHQLKEGILLAYIDLAISGKGSIVSVSLEDAALSSLANQASNYLMTGHVPKLLGSLHPNIAPYGEVFNCKDGYTVILAIGNDKQFQNFCELLQVPSRELSPYVKNIDRVENRENLASLLEPYIRAMNRDDLMEKCHRKRIPIGAIRALDEVLAKPAAKTLIWETIESGVTTKRMHSVAFRVKSNE